MAGKRISKVKKIGVEAIKKSINNERNVIL